MVAATDANGTGAMATATASADPAQDIGIADLPNQRHQLFTRHGASFTILVAGESGLGKTTFINTLFATTLRAPPRYADRHRAALASEKTVGITVTKADLEERGFTLRVNVVDTPGLSSTNTQVSAGARRFLFNDNPVDEDLDTDSRNALTGAEA